MNTYWDYEEKNKASFIEMKMHPINKISFIPLSFILSAPPIMTSSISYRCLDHVVPAIPHVAYEVEDVDGSLGFHLLQHEVYRDESTSTSNTSTIDRQADGRMDR